MAIKVTNNFKKVINDITENKARQVLVAIEAGAAARAIYYAPVAFSNLVNSYFGDVSKHGYRWELKVGFNADYAVYLNGDDNYTPLWKPKPPPKYEVKGVKKRKDGTYATPEAPAPAWNPNAKPRFLDYWGFESPEAKEDIEATIKLIMKL